MTANLVSLRWICRTLWLLAFLAAFGAGDSHAATAVNFDFTDGTLATNLGPLSSVGGTYWNQAGSAAFLPPNSGTPGGLDEFGQAQPPGGFGSYPIALRRSGFSQSQGSQPITGFSDQPLGLMMVDITATTPMIGSVVPVLEIVGARLNKKYDVAVFVGPGSQFGAALSSQRLQLTNIIGMPVVPGEPVASSAQLIDGVTYQRVVWKKLTPTEMHLGEPGTEPLGWALGINPLLVTPAPTTFPIHLEWGGIQVRESVPEPGCATLAWVSFGTLALAARRGKSSTRSVCGGRQTSG